MASVILDNLAAAVPHAEILRSYPAIQALADASGRTGDGMVEFPPEHTV